MTYIYLYSEKEVSITYCVAYRLKDHVKDKTKLPILIFPEGECGKMELLYSCQFVFVPSKKSLSVSVVILAQGLVGSLAAELTNEQIFNVALVAAHASL